MSNDLNRCEFIGRLGKDPETRYSPDGAPITNFSLACGWKSKDKEGTEWVRIVAFGKLAEICGEYLQKGKQIYVAGRMRTREYEKDGDKRYISEIVAETMQMLGGRNDDQGQASSQQRRQAPPQSKPAESRPASGGSLADMDEDIPFGPMGGRKAHYL